MSEWNTHLANKGWITPSKKGGFMTNPVDEVEPVEEEALKEFDVHCYETHYITYTVEARSEAEAIEMVNSGDAGDYHNDDYGDFEISSVEEV